MSKHVMIDPAEWERAQAFAAWNRTTVSARIQDRVAEDAAACSPEILAWFRGEPAVPAAAAAVRAPSRSRRPKDARARCPHQGVRVTGGWCPKCDSEVEPGGALKV